MHRQRARAISTVALASLLCVTAVGQSVAAPPLQGTTSANATAELVAIIQKTERDMLTIQPCNDADPYFAAAILPHREGAVLICQWMSQYGTDPQLLNISDAVYDSTTEDQIYQSMAYLPPCSSSPAPAPSVLPASRKIAAGGRVSQGPALGIRSSMPMPPAAALNGVHNRDFAIQMAAHHKASINMARVELLRGSSEPLKALATDLIVVQTKQVELFRQILQLSYGTYI